MQLPIHLLLTAYRSLLMRVRNRRGQKWLKVRVITLLFLIDKLLQHLRFRHMNMTLRLTLISKAGARSCPPAVFEGFLVFRQHFCALETFWRFHMLTKHVGLPFHRLVQVATEFNSVKRSSFQGV